MSNIQQQIERKLTESLLPVFLKVENESHMHSGPAQESHFKVTVVSDKFEGERLLNRHRMVNTILQEELHGMIHALAIHTYSLQEWTEREGSPDSPACRGGSRP